MPDILIQFLNGRITPELLNLYFRAYSIIEHFEQEDNYDLIENLLVDIDNTDPQVMVDRIYHFHVDQIVNIISEYSITLNDGYHLLDLLKIIEGLLYLEDSEEVEYIIQTIENSENNVDTLCELLGLMTVEDPLLYSEWIKNCSGELLIKIYQNAKKSTHNSIEESNEYPVDKIKVLRQYKDDPVFSKSLVFAWIKKGLRFNLPLAIYINLLKDSLFSEEYTVKDKGVNLAILAFMSNSTDINKDLSEALQDQLDDLSEVSNLISSYQQHTIVQG